MRRLALLPVLGLCACDDTIFVQQSAPVAYTPDWDGTQQLFDDHCVSCHGAPNGTAGVILPDTIAADITDGTGEYVVPGDPDNSKLWRMISNQLQAGDPGVMPIGSPLAADVVAPVRTWIADGALLGADTATP